MSSFLRVTRRQFINSASGTTSNATRSLLARQLSLLSGSQTTAKSVPSTSLTSTSSLMVVAPQWMQQQSRMQLGGVRGISSSMVLHGRNDGNSGFDKAQKRRNQRNLKKQNNTRSRSQQARKERSKDGGKPHLSVQERIAQRNRIEKFNERNAKIWSQLEQNKELTDEYDAIVDHLNTIGADGSYIYQKEFGLEDVDEREMLQKLNELVALINQPAMATPLMRPFQSQENLDSFDKRADALVPADDATESSTTAMENLQMIREQFGVGDYNTLMHLYAIKGLHREANALLTCMEKNFAKDADLVTPSSTAGASSSLLTFEHESNISKEVSDILAQQDHRLTPDIRSYMLYISSLAKEQKAALAVRTLGRMKNHGVMPDVTVYNAVMNVCAKANKMTWAYNIFEKMQQAGLTPDNASFTILMKSAIDNNEVDKAFETFHMMRTYVTEPDDVAFTTMIHGFAEIGRVERAINLMEDLLETGQTPNIVTFNSLILACSRSRHFAHKAMDFYHEMQELYDYMPDLHTYNTLLVACGKNGDVVSLERVLRDMDRHQVPKDQITYHAILNGYARAQDRRLVTQNYANKLLTQRKKSQKAKARMQQSYQQKAAFDEEGQFVDTSKPGNEFYDQEWTEEDEEEYNQSMMLGKNAHKDLERLRREDEERNKQILQRREQGELDDDEEHESEEEEDPSALQLSDQEQDKDVTVFAVSDLSLMKLTYPLVKEEDQDEEEDDGFSPRAVRMRYFPRFRLRNIHQAEKWFEEMKQQVAEGQDGIQITPVALNIMLKVYAEPAREEDVEYFLNEEFEAFGVTPDKYTFRTLLRMFTRTNNTEAAIDLYKDLVARYQDEEDDLERDNIVFGTMVEYFARQKKLREALQVLEHMETLGLPQLPMSYYGKVRALAERFGIFTELIPEDPDEVMYARSRSKLLQKRKVRAESIEFLRSIGKKFLLPPSMQPADDSSELLPTVKAKATLDQSSPKVDA